MIRLFNRAPTLTDTTDRRRNGRFECDDVSSNLGRIVDMSATGIKLRCSAKCEVEIGENKWLAVRNEGGEFCVDTVVRRIERVSKKEIEVGLEFINISDQARNALYRVGQNIPPISKQGIEGC